MNSQREVIILGAGAAGVCAALRLRQQGWRVTLVDAKPPACEASYGNAGIICTASAVPFTNPSLLTLLPKLLWTSHAALHYRLSYCIAQAGWVARFLNNARLLSSAQRRAHQLLALIQHGKALHESWLAQCGLTQHIQRGGWLRAYRSAASFQHAQVERALYDELKIPYRILQRAEIAKMQPAFQDSLFTHGFLFDEGFSVMQPGEVIRAYANWFVNESGEFLQARATGLQQLKNGWRVTLRAHESSTQHSNEDSPAAPTADSITAPHVLIALGAWSQAFLKPLGLRLPLAFERGAHRHFDCPQKRLATAFADVDGGYNATQQDGKIRMTTGVYFAGLDAPPQHRQLRAAEKNLRAALPSLGKAVGEDWFGARPSLPDSLPLIGQTRLPRLWLATGGQHIGWMSAPAIGDTITALMNNDSPPLDPAPFSPSRFNL